jgi:hypothetical protein
MTFVLAADLLAGVLLALRRRGRSLCRNRCPTSARRPSVRRREPSVDGEVIGTLAERPLLTVGGGCWPQSWSRLSWDNCCDSVVGSRRRLRPSRRSPAGRPGVSLMAQQYGADATTVLSVQYLRVLAVIASVPVVAPPLPVGTMHIPMLVARSSRPPVGSPVLPSRRGCWPSPTWSSGSWPGAP